jgi:hypothetical protein
MLNTIVNAKKYECKNFLHDLKGNKFWTLIWRDGCELQLILSHNTYFDSIITFGTIKSSQTAQIIWLSKYLELKSSFNLLYKRIQKKNNNTTKSVMVLLDTSLSKLCLGQQRSSSFLEDLCCFRKQNDAGRQSF